jgi:hypothetical protein
MPTRAQIERSKKRNRERGIDPVQQAKIAEAHDKTRERLMAEAAAGPRYVSVDANGKVVGRGGGIAKRTVDRWGGPDPPAPPGDVA